MLTISITNQFLRHRNILVQFMYLTVPVPVYEQTRKTFIVRLAGLLVCTASFTKLLFTSYILFDTCLLEKQPIQVVQHSTRRRLQLITICSKINLCYYCYAYTKPGRNDVCGASSTRYTSLTTGSLDNALLCRAIMSRYYHYR